MRRIRHGGNCDDSCCLRIQNLSVKIGGDTILQDVNLHIHCGQMEIGRASCRERV